MSMTGWPIDMAVSSEPCPPPHIDEFRIRFPEFEDLSDEQVQLAINDASCWADTTWIASQCQDCTTAIAFLAAHYLALGLLAAAALPDTAVGEGGTGTVLPGGQVTSLSFESMSVGFSAPQLAGASSFAGSGMGEGMGLGTTPYGQRYLQLVKVNKPAILVV